MKTLKNLNKVAIAIPFIIAMLGFTDESLFLVALVSTMITGFIQIVIGIIYAFKFPKSILIKMYLFLVTFFLFSWLVLERDGLIWLLPPSLCAFLTLILYNNKEYENTK